MAKKTKFFFGKAVETWDADFYVKVDDNVKLDLGNYLSTHRFQCLLNCLNIFFHVLY